MGVEQGLKQDCVVNLDNVQTVPKARLRQRLGRLAPQQMARVCRALQVATGCDLSGSTLGQPVFEPDGGAPSGRATKATVGPRRIAS